MRIKILSIIILFLFTTLLMGCGVTVSALDMIQPVLLGKIKRIHGTDIEQPQLKVPFNISFSNTYGYRDGGNKVTAELSNLTETFEDKILIDEVYIGSSSVFFIAPYAASAGGKSWVEIKGGIYHEQAAGHKTK